MAHIGGVTFVNILIVQFAFCCCYMIVPPKEKVFGVVNERYFLSLERVPWINARAICKANHLDFVRFDNVDEFTEFINFLDYNAKAYGKTRIWIGGIFIADAGRWVSNGQPMTYTNWMNDQGPDKGDCIRANKLGWSGFSCGKDHYFACEKRPEVAENEQEDKSVL